MARKYKPDFDETMAKRLRSLMVDTNAIADHLGCSAQAISQYRTGASRPSLGNIVRIAKFYGVSTDYILGLTDDKPPYLTAEERTGFSTDALEKMQEMGPERLAALFTLLKG